MLGMSKGQGQGSVYQNGRAGALGDSSGAKEQPQDLPWPLRFIPHRGQPVQ